MWFDVQAELAKLVGGREIDAPAPATPATSATPAQRIAPHVANVASVATYPDETLGPKESARLSCEALKDLEAATDLANTLLGRLRACDTLEAVFAFLETSQPAIDALEAHASVRKTHLHKLAEYKVASMKKG